MKYTVRWEKNCSTFWKWHPVDSDRDEEVLSEIRIKCRADGFSHFTNNQALSALTNLNSLKTQFTANH
jgi:hypothetical protein